MGNLNLRRSDVKTTKYYGRAQSEKRRCKKYKNTMGKIILRRGDVKTMKIPWENSI